MFLTYFQSSVRAFSHWPWFKSSWTSLERHVCLPTPKRSEFERINREKGRKIPDQFVRLQQNKNEENTFRVVHCKLPVSPSLSRLVCRKNGLPFWPPVQQSPLTTREVKPLSLTLMWRERWTGGWKKESEYTLGGKQRKSEKKGHTWTGRDENPNESSSPNGQPVRLCVHVCVCVSEGVCPTF